MEQVKNIIMSIVLVIVGFVTVFYLIGGTAGTLTTAAQNISGSGLPNFKQDLKGMCPASSQEHLINVLC